jgi:ATP-binding cassette, subfamily B, bacterial
MRAATQLARDPAIGWSLRDVLPLVLREHGKQAPASDLSALPADGAADPEFIAVCEFGRRQGLFVRTLRLAPGDAQHLPSGSLLVWRGARFALLTDRARGTFRVRGPDGGILRLSAAAVDSAEAALVFYPLDSYISGDGEGMSLGRYLKVMLFGQPRILLRIVGLSVVIQMVAILFPLMTGTLVGEVVPRGDHYLLLLIMLSLVLLAAYHWMVLYVRAQTTIALRTSIDVRLSSNFIDHLMGLPFSFFQRWPTGDLAMRLDSHNQVRDIVAHHTLLGAMDALLLLGYAVTLLLVNAQMALLTFLLGALQVVLFSADGRRRRELWMAKLATQRRCHALEHELVSGIETIKSIGAESRMMSHWSDLHGDFLNSMIERWRRDSVVQAGVNTVRLISPVAILCLGAASVLQHQLSLGTMLAHAALANAFLLPLNNLVTVGLEFQTLAPHLKAVQGVLAAPRERGSGKRLNGRLQGELRLDQVTFTADGRNIVDHVSISVPTGTSLAIVGRTGSGKSTLMRLMLGIHTPASGRVLYDGEDLAGLVLSDVRKLVGVVGQHPNFFGVSIRDNIALANPTASTEEIVQAARRACIHEEILQFPQGYDTIMRGEAGKSKFSGGQLQRLALARALVAHPRVLFLDEATSAVDAVVENEIQRNIMTEPCTKVVVAHRINTIMDCDRIVVLRDGRVAESGSHRELLALNGEYAALVHAQARDGQP